MSASADNEKTTALSRRDLMGAPAAVAAFTFVPKRVLSEAGQSSTSYIAKFYRTGWYFD